MPSRLKRYQHKGQLHPGRKGHTRPIKTARPKAWSRDDFALRFATINGLLGLIVDAPEGPVQTAAFEIEGDIIRALYVVRNPEKLRHLAPARYEIGPG